MATRPPLELECLADPGDVYALVLSVPTKDPVLEWHAVQDALTTALEGTRAAHIAVAFGRARDAVAHLEVTAARGGPGLLREAAPLPRLFAAALDWARDVALDAGVLASVAAFDADASARIATYAELHVRAFVLPSLRDARAHVAAHAPAGAAPSIVLALDEAEAAIVNANTSLRESTTRPSNG